MVSGGGRSPAAPDASSWGSRARLVARFNWSPNSSSSSSRRRVSSSTSDRSRAWLACTVRSCSLAYLGRNRACEPRVGCFAPDFRRDAFHLEQHAPRLDDGNPRLELPLPFPMRVSAGFLGDGLVREDTHPDASATFDVTRERDTRRFDLARGQPSAIRRLQAEIAECQPDLRARPSCRGVPSSSSDV